MNLRHRFGLFAVVAVMVVLLMFGAAAWVAIRRAAPRRPDSNTYGAAVTQTTEVAPVSGPSWVNHLGLDPSQTPIGSMGGSEPPLPSPLRIEPDLPSQMGEGSLSAAAVLTATFRLDGADLYRINCRSCHGLDGKGSPPLINSLLPVAAALADEPVQQAAAGLQGLIAQPPETMPPFPSLELKQVSALLVHLEALAVSSRRFSPQQIVVPASWVGQQVVMGSCHICHDATGPGGGYRSMMGGVTPSLASFPENYSLGTVEYAVHYGSSGMMRMMRRGRPMPPLPYFTSQEVAAAYLYLAAYPPR